MDLFFSMQRISFKSPTPLFAKTGIPIANSSAYFVGEHPVFESLGLMNTKARSAISKYFGTSDLIRV